MKASQLLSRDQSRMVKCSPRITGSRGTGVEVAGSVGGGGSPVWVGVDVAAGVTEANGASGEPVWLGIVVEDTAPHAVKKIRRQSIAGFGKRICLGDNSFEA